MKIRQCTLLNAALNFAKKGWHVFPISPNKKAPPLVKDWQNIATTNENQIKQWWKENPDANIGLATGKLSCIWVLDIDVKNGKKGGETLKRLEATLGKFDTIRVKTPSGGRHIYFKYSEKHQLGNKVDVLNGVDIRSDGGYVVAPNSRVNGRFYKFTIDTAVKKAPDLLYEILKYGEDIIPESGISEGRRNDSIFKYSMLLRKKGLSRNSAEALVTIMASNCIPEYDVDDAIRCIETAWSYEYIKTENDYSEIINELNKKHGTLFVGNKYCIIKESYDPIRNRTEVNFIQPTDFYNYYANRQVDNGKGKKVSIAKIWFQSPERRQYDGIIFSPNNEHQNYYNLWRGYGCEPKKGDCSLYYKHILENICAGDEDLNDYVLCWMADAVQNITKKPGTSLVLRGAQGTGKSLFAEIFGSLFGQHFIAVSQSKHLVGNFNAHLNNTCLVLADEAIWAGDKSHEGALKALITQDTIAIEHKGKDVITVPNNIRVIIASNNNWAVPAGLEERRFVILDVAKNNMQNHEYFAKIIHQIENGGREALLYDMLNMDISDFNLRQIPKTKALNETKIISMSPIQRFWLDMLMSGTLRELDDSWPEWIPIRVLFGKYREHAGQSGIINRSNETLFGIEMHRLLPPSSTTSKRRSNLVDSNNPVKGYTLPSLKECREYFENITQSHYEWDK